MDFSIDHNPIADITAFPHPICDAMGVRIDVKRLDAIHPTISGNKWYKLKYNLERAMAADHRTLLTMGGAWSNHIYATAAAGAAAGIRTIGVIRGEEPAAYSSTLRFAREQGMTLKFISRLDYEERNTEEFKAWLHDEFGAFHLVPEGGSNYYGVNGCMEILAENDLRSYSHVACASGTGATLAGMLLGSKGRAQFIGFSALKGGEFLQDEVIKHIEYFLMDRMLAEEFRSQFNIETAYHFGGYGKWNDELIAFIRTMETDYALPLDQVYTGKALYGLLKKIEQGEIERGSNVLFIHTGGLQGRAGCDALAFIRPELSS